MFQTFIPFSSRRTLRASVKAFLPLAALFTLAGIADEAALLRQLASRAPEERDAARQSLLVTATPAAIPQLASQLKQAETFDNACFLLEALSVPEADTALRAALASASGREQAGRSYQHLSTSRRHRRRGSGHRPARPTRTGAVRRPELSGAYRDTRRARGTRCGTA